MNTLDAFGWNPFFANRFEAYAGSGYAAGRVTEEHKGAYRLHSEFGELTAEISGKMRYEASGRGPGRAPAAGC